MDLTGISKRAWRARLIECYQHCSGNTKLPPKQYFFTLGGACYHNFSELDYLSRHRKFLHPKQYISVERDYLTHQGNLTINGPTWLYGDFAEQFADWTAQHPHHILGVVSADFMCGIEKAIPDLRSIFRALWPHFYKQKTLVAINLIERSWQRERFGNKFKPVWETFQRQMGKERYRKLLVDRFQYANNPMSRNSTVMETLLFWL
jgi:hypothetical protein